MLFIICLLLLIPLLAIIARIVLSWLPLRQETRAAEIAGFVYWITDPLLRPFQRIIPIIRIGAVRLDFSSALLVILLLVLRNILC